MNYTVPKSLPASKSFQFGARHFSRNVSLPYKLDLAKETAALNLDQVKSLPHCDTVKLSHSIYKSHNARINTELLPIVLIHGLFGSKQNYTSVGKQLSERTGRLVLGLDMRNHGTSRHVAPHTYYNMAEDVLHFIGELGDVAAPKKVILAGHSMGGKVSMLASLLEPAIVEKLIVIDNSPASEHLDEQFSKDLVGMCHAEMESSVSGLSPHAQKTAVDNLLAKYEPSPLVRTFLMSNLAKRTSSKTKDHPVKFRVPVLNFLKENTLHELGGWPAEKVEKHHFSGPVLVLKAAQSNFIKREQLSTDFAKYFSNISYVEFDCGHWLVSEQPKKFVDVVTEFVK